jgi:carbon monoxide dehydrogenase subunit G
MMRVLCLAAALLGSSGWAATATPPDCRCRDLGDRLLFARGTVDIAVPPERVFATVTDYDRIAAYVSAVDSSRVVRRDSTGVLVRQVARLPGLLPLSVRTTLRFRPEPPLALRFEIVAGDLAVYYGDWRFEEAGAATRLVYSVTMRPPVFLPAVVVHPALEALLCRTLAEVRSEAERRQSAAIGLEERHWHP